MMYRAKITSIPNLPNIMKQYAANTIVKDAKNIWIEVCTEKEASLIEELNELAFKLYN